MARFDALEQSLNQDQAIKCASNKQLKKFLDDAQAQYQPQLVRAYGVLDEFYHRFLRTQGFLPLARIKENLSPAELSTVRGEVLISANVVNVIPPISEQPYFETDPFWIRNFPIQASEFDYHVWHPNVALHFEALITSFKLDDKLSNPKLSIVMKAWGTTEDNEKEPSPEGVNSKTIDGGWNTKATLVWVEPKDEHLEEQVQHGLTLIARNALHPKDSFRGS